MAVHLANLSLLAGSFRSRNEYSDLDDAILIDQAVAEISQLRADLARVTAERDMWQTKCLDTARQLGGMKIELAWVFGIIKDIVELADTDPFCSIGHVVEHAMPELRELAKGRS